MGGRGPKRTPALAARFAAEFNSFGADPARFVEAKARVANACAQIGRDPESLVYSIMCPTIVGRDEADLLRQAQRRLDFQDQKDAPADWITAMQNGGALVGTLDQVAERMNTMARAGCQRFHLQIVPLDDDGMLDLIVSDLLPRLQ